MSIKNKPLITVSWSGGKDSALALYRIIRSGEWQIDHLHTVINVDTRRVGLHGIHEDLIEKQAGSIGLPLRKLYLDPDKTNNAYQKMMQAYCDELSSKGIKHVMFGDIFLEDLKDYRDTMLKSAGLTGIYPLWKENSADLLKEFLSVGFRSVLCAADATKIGKDTVGRELAEEMIDNEFKAIDPCGENGEYHSFVVSGPVFQHPISVDCRSVTSRDYTFEALNEGGEKEEHHSSFWFADLQLE